MSTSLRKSFGLGNLSQRSSEQLSGDGLGPNLTSEPRHGVSPSPYRAPPLEAAERDAWLQELAAAVRSARRCCMRAWDVGKLGFQSARSPE